MRRVSIVGAGKLGAPIATAIASQGHHVAVNDADPRVIESLHAGRAPVTEPGLQPLIDAHRDRLRATASIAEAVDASEITFVIVPTPSTEGGGFAVDAVDRAFREIGAALARKKEWHTVVLTSTVMPGATRALVPALEAASGRHAGDHFGVCYNPVFVALGTVVRNFLHPDLVLIGELDRRSGDHLEACHRDILGSPPPAARMSFENAELTKLAINAFVTTKITFANMLADLCAALPGGDVDVVSDAIGRDTRIGRKYLTGGLGFGGPCFPRDNAALAAAAAALGVDAGLPLATDRLNRALADRTLAALQPNLRAGATVAVLGQAYKPGSDVIEASPALAITTALLERHGQLRVRVCDPLAGEAVRAVLGERVVVSGTARECVRGADVVIVATPDPAFTHLSAADLAADGRRVVVLDYWRLLAERLSSASGIEYIAHGRGRQDVSTPR
jgi:UDPglucose 6-dehydrogenase